MSGVRLLVAAYELNAGNARPPRIERRFSSSDYGAKKPSASACWSIRARLPFAMTFSIVPVGAREDEDERLSLAMDLED
jgi:hypothetical protein